MAENRRGKEEGWGRWKSDGEEAEEKSDREEEDKRERQRREIAEVSLHRGGLLLSASDAKAGRVSDVVIKRRERRGRIVYACMYIDCIAM